MVNSILQYIEPQLKAYMQFLNRVDSPVFRVSNGEMIKGNGQEKEVVTINDLNGNSLYIRQTQPESINQRKSLSSCDKEYNISARCKVVFYTFGGNDFTVSPDKVKSKIVNTLARLDFSHYTGSSTEIKIDVNATSLDMEKIYTEETGKQFEGNVWPTFVSVDFTLSYVDTNCNTCDIEEGETVVTWTPDLTPENCETKAICEAVAGCQVVKDLQAETESLQEQIDNLPTGGLTCDDLPACQTIIDILASINSIISNLPSSYFTCADLEFCQYIIDIVSDISSIQSQVGTNSTDISTIQGQVSQLITDLGTLTTDLSNHTSNTSNPHQVTLEQARNQNNSLNGDINANTNTIINLKDAVNPQEPITKMQFDTYVSSVGGQRGDIDCSANPNYPASNKGDRWEVTVAGIIGGALGIYVQVYDEIVCKTTSISGDQAAVGANFYVVQGNLERATETVSGYIQLATDVEVQAGTENTKAVTALKLWNFFVAFIQSVFVKKGTLTTNYLQKATASDTVGNSMVYESASGINIGTQGLGYARIEIMGGAYQGIYIQTAGSIGLNAVETSGIANKSEVSTGIAFRGNISDVNGIGIDIEYTPTSTKLFKLYGNGNLDVLGLIKNLSLTASQYMKTDASKNLISVAAIPATDVTQDSTHRFATDTEKTSWNAKEPAIATGTTAQYWRGDKSWQGLGSAILGQVLTGLSLATSQTIAATDTVILSFGYIQAQITVNTTAIGLKSNTASPTFTGTVTTPAIIVSSETSSRLAIIDASKNLKSADISIYPSLPELAFVKGLTSAIQPQLDSKLSLSSTILFTHSQLNPADGITYFFGAVSSNAANTSTTALRRGFAPFNGFIYGGLIQVQVASTLGTSETATLKINNKTQSTTVTMLATVKYDVIAAGFAFTLGSPFSVNANDSLEIEVNMPTFATNPTNVQHFVYLNFGSKA